MKTTEWILDYFKEDREPRLQQTMNENRDKRRQRKYKKSLTIKEEKEMLKDVFECFRHPPEDVGHLQRYLTVKEEETIAKKYNVSPDYVRFLIYSFDDEKPLLDRAMRTKINQKAFYDKNNKKDYRKNHR